MVAPAETSTNARLVEDEAGRRFWLFREGLYRETHEPRWFVHGLFA